MAIRPGLPVRHRAVRHTGRALRISQCVVTMAQRVARDLGMRLRGTTLHGYFRRGRPRGATLRRLAGAVMGAGRILQESLPCHNAAPRRRKPATHRKERIARCATGRAEPHASRPLRWLVGVSRGIGQVLKESHVAAVKKIMGLPVQCTATLLTAAQPAV